MLTALCKRVGYGIDRPASQPCRVRTGTPRRIAASTWEYPIRARHSFTTFLLLSDNGCVRRWRSSSTDMFTSCLLGCYAICVYAIYAQAASPNTAGSRSDTARRQIVNLDRVPDETRALHRRRQRRLAPRDELIREAGDCSTGRARSLPRGSRG